MRYLLSLILLSLSLPSLAAEGDTLYVSDIIQLNVRATACETCRILQTGLSSGAAVIDLGEQQDDWIRVRTETGIEGWVLSRFLQAEQVARNLLPQLETDLAALRAENGQLQAQINQLLNELEEAGLAVESVPVTDADGVSRAPVMQISGDVIGLNAQNQELVRRNQLMQHELDILVAENERLLDTRWRTWFVYGGLAVFAGALLSVLITRLKKRRGFSEWA